MNPVLIFGQDSGGLLRLAADARNFRFDIEGAISTNSDVVQGFLTDLSENVVSWIQFKDFKLFNILY